ncbi:MAG: tetratricopeptide repeat protein, partial [candidate division Zixibacteria bacterium]|nr:tetratricopeptide repeat protein [candidate division Zixibacteria bacterium]
MDTQDTTSSKETVSKETTPEEAKSIETAAKDASAVDLISKDGAAKEADTEEAIATEKATNQAVGKVRVSDESVPRDKSATQKRVDPLTLVDDSYWPARALRALRESRFSEAITLCDAGLHDDNPAPISGFLIKAQALASLGRLKDSLSTLTDALSADPENQMAFKLLGDIHFAEGEEEAAMSYYRRIHSQRSQEDTTGIALEIGAPLSAALKKVFMSRTTSNAIDDTSERASQKKATQKRSSQSGEPKIAPSPTSAERRPYQVEEQETPDNVVESVIEKTEEPTPSGVLKKSPLSVGRSSERVQTSEKPDNSAGSTDKEPTPRGGAPVIEKPPAQSEKPPMQSAETRIQSEKPPMQSAETRIQSEKPPMQSAETRI